MNIVFKELNNKYLLARTENAYSCVFPQSAAQLFPYYVFKIQIQLAPKNIFGNLPVKSTQHNLEKKLKKILKYK